MLLFSIYPYRYPPYSHNKNPNILTEYYIKRRQVPYLPWRKTNNHSSLQIHRQASMPTLHVSIEKNHVLPIPSFISAMQNKFILVIHNKKI